MSLDGAVVHSDEATLVNREHCELPAPGGISSWMGLPADLLNPTDAIIEARLCHAGSLSG